MRMSFFVPAIPGRGEEFDLYFSILVFPFHPLRFRLRGLSRMFWFLSFPPVSLCVLCVSNFVCILAEAGRQARTRNERENELLLAYSYE